MTEKFAGYKLVKRDQLLLSAINGQMHPHSSVGKHLDWEKFH